MTEFDFGDMFDNEIIATQKVPNENVCIREGFTLTIEIPEEVLQAER